MIYDILYLISPILVSILGLFIIYKMTKKIKKEVKIIIYVSWILVSSIIIYKFTYLEMQTSSGNPTPFKPRCEKYADVENKPSFCSEYVFEDKKGE